MREAREGRGSGTKVSADFWWGLRGKVGREFCTRPSGEILMVADANLFTRDDSADLAKRRNNLELIIGYTYKFKILYSYNLEISFHAKI